MVKEATLSSSALVSARAFDDSRLAVEPDQLGRFMERTPAQDESPDTLEADQKATIDPSTKVDSRTEVTDEVEDQPLPLYLGQRAIIPEVRKCNIAQYKNRFKGADEALYAVDVLETDNFFVQEVQEELKLRQALPKRKNPKDRKTSKSKLPAIAKPIRKMKAGNKLIERIRIQSPALLQIISRVMHQSWDSRPRTFFRSFSPLIYFHGDILEVFRELDAKWGNSDGYSDVHDASRTPASLDEIHESEGSGSVDDSPAALEELRCYVEFMAREILPLYSQFDNLEATSNAKVRFRDLWYLFRIGDLIYRPIGTDKEVNNPALGNRTWRVYGIRTPWSRYRIEPVDHRNYLDEDSERHSFALYAYYIDFTGDEFGIVSQTFEIPPYDGERLVTSLKVFPFRFAPNWRDSLEAYKGHGRKFLHYIESRHAVYNWWTMILTPSGDPTTDSDGNVLKRPEYVDSEVIVDFVEAIQTSPSWQPTLTILKPQEPNPSTTADDFYICWWSDPERTRLLAETAEIVVLSSGVSAFEHNRNLTRDRFLAAVRENDRNGVLTTAKYLRDEDLPLLPSRVFAYVLRDRKFVPVDIQKIQPVKESYDAWDCLKIDTSTKTLVSSLVSDHFSRKKDDKRDGIERSSLDLIKGKGKGLFILLHGVPGVGKTASAEAVAQAFGKPLFAITCGDLGLTPGEVETALRRIFRLANAWDCVLLLDEVDTFFSQRSRGDSTLTKNALVSVFLRVLEYYDGLLFLTTNRPGALDEAFKSRIHLKLYYPPLDFDQTMDIWEMNIQRLRKAERERCEGTDEDPILISEKEILRFASLLFNQDKGKFRWNGRQIRNAFQIASSLACFESRRDGTQPQLTVKHFRTIHNVTEDFDHFMEETAGRTDGELAFTRGDRADHWSREPARAETSQAILDPAPPLSPAGAQLGGRRSLGQRPPSFGAGRRPVSPMGGFDLNASEPSNIFGLQPSPSPSPAQPRPLFHSRPSISFNDGPLVPLGNSEPRPHRGSDDLGSGDRYGHQDVAYSPTYGEAEGSGSNLGGRRRELERTDSDPQAARKRRRMTEYDDDRTPFG